MNSTLYCSDCKVDRIIADHAFVHEGQWIDNIWLKYKKKSVHSRNRWTYKKLCRCVEDQCIDHICDDFIKEEKLISGRNVSRYNYYIIRLCSRRGIPLKCHVKDMVDDRLFGVVYPQLGRDKYCNCLYYLA